MTFLVERLADLRRHLDHLREIRPRVSSAAVLETDLTLHNDVLFSLLVVSQAVIDIAGELAEALKLYTALPLEVRQMLIRLEQELGSRQLAATVGAAVRSAVLTAAFDAMAEKLPPLDLTESEIDALSEEAVQWARHQERG